MKRIVSILIALTLIIFSSAVSAQRRGGSRNSRSASAAVKKVAANKAIVVDQRLAVLRASPSLYARPIQRMSGGRRISVGETREADGVMFYRVSTSTKSSGWIQADALAGNFRRGDDERLARLVQGSEGFERIERASIFLEMFPASPLRPPILLLYGDLIEEEAVRLSGRATRNLDRREMAGSGAPLHSFYLNFSFLDRYRKLGVVFLFNAGTKNYHYDGATWKELIKKFPDSAEAAEAQKRLDALALKLEREK